MVLVDFLLILLSFFILILGVLVGVAFLTLLERKVLGYIQIRKGPNKVGLSGILQPFSDALKLFSKEQSFPYLSSLIVYYLCPVINLFISLLIWSVLPFFSFFLNFSLSLLFFLCVSSVMVYTIMLAGWSSNSNYSLLGSLRSVAQSISYEVSLALILMSYIYLVLSLDLGSFLFYQSYIWLSFFTLPLVLMWLVSGLAETNRTPFDFAEGESELVSGFNVEYSSGGFAMIFMAEYAGIIFMCMFSVMIFLGGDYNSFFFFFKVVLMVFFWVWVRGTLPRFRYDKLMYLSWKVFLPVSLFYILFFLNFTAVCVFLI